MKTVIYSITWSIVPVREHSLSFPSCRWGEPFSSCRGFTLLPSSETSGLLKVGFAQETSDLCADWTSGRNRVIKPVEFRRETNETGRSTCTFRGFILHTSAGLTFFSGGSLKVGPLKDEDVPLISSSRFPRLLSSGVVGSRSSFFLLALFVNASCEKRWTRGRSNGERSEVESGLRTVVKGGGSERWGLDANKKPESTQPHEGRRRDSFDIVLKPLSQRRRSLSRSHLLCCHVTFLRRSQALLICSSFRLLKTKNGHMKSLSVLRFSCWLHGKASK